MRCPFVWFSMLALGGCTSIPQSHAAAPRGGVTIIAPQCPDVRSCLLGHVVTSDGAVPLAQAAVFLEREDDLANDQALRLQTLTDDQGVFTIEDAPEGRYRLAIYKDARCVQTRGLRLGDPGTTVLPIRLPPC